MKKSILIAAAALWLTVGGRAATCELSNGQSAVLALGQPGLTSNAVNNGGVSASSLHWPYRLDSDGTRLIVPDANNHRVLIWNTMPSNSGQPADVVLGQADFSSNQANRGGAVAANTLSYPSSARVDGGRLVVADYNNNRVLIWNSIPTVNGQAADVVVGQADFTSNGINRGAGIGSPQANSLYQASSARIIGGRLYVLDAFNHRVLIFNTVPAANSPSADLVLGQSSFTTNSSGASASKMQFPNDLESDGTRLWVVDANNNRVLGWSSFPTSNGQAADFALGQTTLTGTVQGAGTTGLYAMNTLLLHNGDLFVSDYGNNRVLRYSPAPSSFAPAADLVLGQADFSGTSANRGGAVAANTLSWPYGLAIVDGALWVTDMNNHRVLKYGCLPSSTPTPTPLACSLSNGQDAALVLGQTGFNSDTANQGGAAAANTLQRPYSHHWDGTYFWVNDANNSRVLRYTGLPSASNASADLVLGQANFSGSLQNRGGTPGAHTLNHNHGVFSTGSQLVVADSRNHRVLIWNSLPTSNGQPADVVLGQANFSSILTNETGNTLVATSQSMFFPTDVEVVGGRLFVVDKDNQRVLAYNSIPSSSHAPADYVLFQADLNSNQPNRNAGVPAANSIHHPHGIASDGTRLAVSDYFNNRVLLFNSIPTSNDPSADVVVGQTGFNTATLGTALANHLYLPRDVSFNGSQLVVTDSGWNRILIYNSIPSTHGASADVLIGQSAWGAGGYDKGLGSVNAGGFEDPSRASIYNGKLWVSDWNNNRVLAFDCGAIAPTATVTATPTTTPVVGTSTNTRTITPTVTPTYTMAVGTSTNTPTVTPTATPSLTTVPFSPTATRTPTVSGPAVTATAVPTKVKRDDKRVQCFPNYVRGRGQVMKILVRSYSGGRCSLKVNRPNGRVLGELWKGYLAPQEIKKQDWDTKDSSGAETPSGVYYVVFTDGDGSIQVQKVLIVR